MSILNARGGPIGKPGPASSRLTGLYKITFTSSNLPPDTGGSAVELVSNISFGTPILQVSGAYDIKTVSVNGNARRTFASSTGNSIRYAIGLGSSAPSDVVTDSEPFQSGFNCTNNLPPLMSIAYNEFRRISTGVSDRRYKVKWYGTTGSPTAGTVCSANFTAVYLVKLDGALIANNARTIVNIGTFTVEEV